MNVTEFFLKWKGKYLDNDGAYGYQCVDVIKQYFQEVLDLPVFKGDAIDYWNKDVPGFTKIKKTWYNQPQPGDIIVFNTPPYGHISIVNWSRIFDFGGFEQNYPFGTPCHYQDHNYKGVLGWLRPLPKSNGIQIARVGINLPPKEDLINEVAKYSSAKLVLNDYTIPVSSPSIFTQNDVMDFLSKHDFKETFVQFYYQSPNAPFLVSYGVPGTNKYASTLPNNPLPNLIAFELSHVLQYYCNDKLKAGILVEDSNFPDEAFIRRKFSLVEKYINQIN